MVSGIGLWFPHTFPCFIEIDKEHKKMGHSLSENWTSKHTKLELNQQIEFDFGE